MPKIISMFRILPSIMAGISINIKQPITMTEKVSSNFPAIVFLILSIFYLIRITLQIDLQPVLDLASGMKLRKFWMRCHAILACIL